MGTLLELEAIEVRFGGVTANAGVHLDVQEGEIAALIGPNGAGKTTLFNVVTGAVAPTAGTVRFGGEDITALSRVARARRGIARTFQLVSLVGELSALDNVTVGLGRYRRHGLTSALVRGRRGVAEDAEIRALARRALALVDLASAADLRADDLPFGDRRRIEVARALALAPRLLLLDEPSSGMDPAETAALAAAVRRARDELGVTVLVVEHDMSFVRTLAERTTVLDFGQVIAAGPTASVLADPAVAQAYLGVVASRA
jgi:branched-chain amino acid transport system ATP-binding protein